MIKMANDRYDDRYAYVEAADRAARALRARTLRRLLQRLIERLRGAEEWRAWSRMALGDRR
jgi:hypothetical protein